MRFVTAKRGTGFSWVALLGIVCIALVLTTSIVSVTHSHPSGQFEHDCALCFMAHQTIQVAVIVTAFVTAHFIAQLTRERFDPLPRQRFVLKLVNRPPPVPAAFA